MKLLFALLSLATTMVLCSATITTAELATFKLAAIEECDELGVMDWNLAELPEDTNVSSLRKCKTHPSELGVVSSKYDLDAEEANLTSPVKRGELAEHSELIKRGICTQGGRGHGIDYDYGCENGWCWRNCDGPFGGVVLDPTSTKTWCWLAYESGNGDWTPCGRWQDCEWSYNNKAAKCGKGNCNACGCGC